MNNVKRYDEAKVEYAGFIIRWVAFTIDNAILAFLTIMLLFPFPTFEDGTLVGIHRTIITLLLIFLTIYFWVKFDGATPGKKLMNIKIVHADSFETIDFKTGAKRYLGYIFSSIIFLVGFLMVAFKSKKQGLHDLFSKTAVVYTDSLVELKHSGDGN